MIKHFRPGTVDEHIIKEVYEFNSYRLPENMKGMVFVDIGAHIGSATVLASERGAYVLAIEPNKENYNLLIENTKDFDLIEICNVAIGTRELFKKLFNNPNNTGGHSLYCNWKDFGQDENLFELVRVVSLAEVLKSYEITHVDILKLDAEGAEKEIVDQILSKEMPIIRNIVAEFHYSNNENEELVEKLCRLYTHKKISNSEYMFKHRLYGD